LAEPDLGDEARDEDLWLGRHGWYLRWDEPECDSIAARADCYPPPIDRFAQRRTRAAPRAAAKLTRNLCPPTGLHGGNAGTLPRSPRRARAGRGPLSMTIADRGGEAPRLLHELFETTADSSPDNVALVCGQELLTYRELESRANRLAHHLRSVG